MNMHEHPGDSLSSAASHFSPFSPHSWLPGCLPHAAGPSCLQPPTPQVQTVRGRSSLPTARSPGAFMSRPRAPRQACRSNRRPRAPVCTPALSRVGATGIWAGSHSLCRGQGGGPRGSLRPWSQAWLALSRVGAIRHIGLPAAHSECHCP